MFAGLLLNGLLAHGTAAHPHAWIDAKVEVIFNAAGEATALHETWLFDEFYTAFVAEGLDEDRDGKPDEAKLNELLDSNMSSLEEYRYFTLVRSGDVEVANAKVSTMSSRMRGDRLEMSFVLPFVAPVSMATPLRYAVFDPTYYIEMLHADAKDAIRLVGAPPGCRTRMARPNPSPEAIALAFSLDRTEMAADTLGAQFAEWITVACD